MAGAGRKGDRATCPADSHGRNCCPHRVEGPATNGSSSVFVNGRSILRADDTGKHSGCCGEMTWTAQRGAPTVFANGRSIFRMGDTTTHCGGEGFLQEGSTNVIIGDDPIYGDHAKNLSKAWPRETQLLFTVLGQKIEEGKVIITYADGKQETLRINQGRVRFRAPLPIRRFDLIFEED